MSRSPQMVVSRDSEKQCKRFASQSPRLTFRLIRLQSGRQHMSTSRSGINPPPHMRTRTSPPITAHYRNIN